MSDKPETPAAPPAQKPKRPNKPSPTEKRAQVGAAARAASRATEEAKAKAETTPKTRKSVKTGLSVQPGKQEPKKQPSLKEVRALASPVQPATLITTALPRNPAKRQEILRGKRKSKSASTKAPGPTAAPAAKSAQQPALTPTPPNTPSPRANAKSAKQPTLTPTPPNTPSPRANAKSAQPSAATATTGQAARPALNRLVGKRDLPIGSMSPSAKDDAAKRAAPDPKSSAALGTQAPKPDTPKPAAPAPEMPAAPAPSKGDDLDDDKKKNKNIFLEVGAKVAKTFSSTEGMIALAVVATLLGGPVAGLAVLGALSLTKAAHAGYKASKSGGQEGPSQGNSEQQKDGQGKAQGQGQEASKSQGMSKATKGALIAASATALIGPFFPPAFLATGAILAGVGLVEAGKAAGRGVKKLHSMNMNRIANNKAKAAEKATGQGQSQGLAQAQSQSQGKGQEATQQKGKGSAELAQPGPSQQPQAESRAQRIFKKGTDVSFSVAAAIGPKSSMSSLTLIPISLAVLAVGVVGSAVVAGSVAAVDGVIKVGKGVKKLNDNRIANNKAKAAEKAAGQGQSQSQSKGQAAAPSIPGKGTFTQDNPMNASKPAAPAPSAAQPTAAKSASNNQELAEARKKKSLMPKASLAKATAAIKAFTNGVMTKLTNKVSPSTGPAKAVTRNAGASR